MSGPVQTIEAANTVSLSDLWDPLYDSFDVDLVVKVLAYTAFSEHNYHMDMWTISRTYTPQAHSSLSSSRSFTTSRDLAGPTQPLSSSASITWLSLRFVSPLVLLSLLVLNLCVRTGFSKWCSRLHRNQGNLLFGPPRLDWGNQLVVVTGGASGIGELIANTLAVRNVTVAVLDVNPIVTENCESAHLLPSSSRIYMLPNIWKDNIAYYKCDVSKWEEVDRVSKQLVEEVSLLLAYSSIRRVVDLL